MSYLEIVVNFDVGEISKILEKMKYKILEFIFSLFRMLFFFIIKSLKLDFINGVVWVWFMLEI